MISPRGVAFAALFILGVQSSLLDDIRSKFGAPSNRASSGGLFSNSKSAFGSGFVMPTMKPGTAGKIHSSSSHKGQHHSSGSSSNTHTLTVVGADGKNLTEESSKKNGFNKDSKIDQAQEDTMIRGADGSVAHEGKSHNKSSVDEGDYALENLKRQETGKDGHSININNNKIANHTRAAALDEANEFVDLQGADGTRKRNSTGHKNTDEHLGKYELENKSHSEINADGSSHNVSSSEGSIGSSHKSDQLAYSDAEDIDAAGNKKTSNYSKKASSDSGTSSDFKTNLEGIKNADGTSFTNSTGNFANKTWDKASAEEAMQKKTVNQDGTSSLEATRVGSNSSKVDGSSGSYSDVNAIGLNGTSSHVASNKTNDYHLDEANQSAGSISEVIGKNGTRSLQEKSIESGRKDESNNNTSVDIVDTKAADGSVSSLHSKSASGTSSSERGNRTHELSASVDEHGNVKNHSIDGVYRNKKTGEYGKSDMSASHVNADGTMNLTTFGNDTARNTYEAENGAIENLSEKNADGTFREESKGSRASVNRTDGHSNVHAGTYVKGLNGVESNQTVAGSQSYNTSDAESAQWDHLNALSANGTAITHNKDSKQSAASANSKSSLDMASSSKSANGTQVSSVVSEANDSHDDVKASSDTDSLHVKHADGSETQSNDASVQTASEHNDSSKRKTHDSVKNADGSFSDISSDEATKNALKDATDERSNSFVNVDSKGNSVAEEKKSLVAKHSNDSDATSNRKVHTKEHDGTELNDVKSSNVSSSSLTEAQLAAHNKNLQMANGDRVVSQENSEISHEKNRNDAASAHKMDLALAGGASVHLDEAANSHSDLETRGESAKKQNYQKIGDVEAQSDVGYEKSMAKGGDKSSSHKNSLSDDGKGHFTKETNGTDSHHEIDNKDIKKHNNWAQT